MFPGGGTTSKPARFFILDLQAHQILALYDFPFQSYQHLKKNSFFACFKLFKYMFNLNKNQIVQKQFQVVPKHGNMEQNILVSMHMIHSDID